MSKKITITKKQKQQFNWMLNTLEMAALQATPKQLKRMSAKQRQMSVDEALIFNYEIMQHNAKGAIKGVKPIE